MNRLHTVKRHWPVAIATLIFLLGSLRKAVASYGNIAPRESLFDSPIFVLSMFTVVLIVAALVLTNMHRKSIYTKPVSKKKSKSK